MSPSDQVRAAVVGAVAGQQPVSVSVGSSQGLNRQFKPSWAAVACFQDCVATAVLPAKTFGVGSMTVEVYPRSQIMAVDENEGERAMNYIEKKNAGSITGGRFGGVGDLTQYHLLLRTERGDFDLMVGPKRLGEIRPTTAAIMRLIG